MAKLIYPEKSRTGRVRFRVPYVAADGKRRMIRLASVQAREAETIAKKIQELASLQAAGTLPDGSLVSWTAGLRQDIREKLVNAGLVKATKSITLSKWLNEYIDNRTDVKPRTKRNLERARDNLLSVFGDARELRTITPSDCQQWRRWMLANGNERDKTTTKLSEATVRRRTGRAKQFFTEAVARGYITENPFDGLASASQANKSRQEFVSVETIGRVMKALPAGDWQTILALSRFGGLRIPSELVGLRWADIDFGKSEMRIHSTKTEHLEDGGVRVCPLFKELRPYLQAARELMPADAEFVIGNPAYRDGDANLWTQLSRYLKAAGVKQWPKLFQNLRATRQTELESGGFPLADVSDWLGNSEAVAQKHYMISTKESFQRAIEDGAG